MPPAAASAYPSPSLPNAPSIPSRGEPNVASLGMPTVYNEYYILTEKNTGEELEGGNTCKGKTNKWGVQPTGGRRVAKKTGGGWRPADSGPVRARWRSDQVTGWSRATSPRECQAAAGALASALVGRGVGEEEVDHQVQARERLLRLGERVHVDRELGCAKGGHTNAPEEAEPGSGPGWDWNGMNTGRASGLTAGDLLGELDRLDDRVVVLLDRALQRRVAVGPNKDIRIEVSSSALVGPLPAGRGRTGGRGERSASVVRVRGPASWPARPAPPRPSQRGRGRGGLTTPRRCRTAW